MEDRSMADVWTIHYHSATMVHMYEMTWGVTGVKERMTMVVINLPINLRL